jgi:hypothetical protein
LFAEKLFWSLLGLQHDCPSFATGKKSKGLLRCYKVSFTRLFSVVRSSAWERLDLLALLKSYGTASARKRNEISKNQPKTRNSHSPQIEPQALENQCVHTMMTTPWYGRDVI